MCCSMLSQKRIVGGTAECPQAMVAVFMSNKQKGVEEMNMNN